MKYLCMKKEKINDTETKEERNEGFALSVTAKGEKLD